MSSVLPPVTDPPLTAPADAGLGADKDTLAAVDAALSAAAAGAVVMASPYCATPTTLLAGLARRSREVPDIALASGMLLGDLPFLNDVISGRLKFSTWHVTGRGRDLAAAGALDYIPMRARDVVPYLRARVGVALARVTPPDAHGNVSLGPSASYTKAMLSAARLRIAEIDPALPRTYGADVTFPLSEFEHVVDSAAAIAVYQAGVPTDVSTAIAGHVIPLLRDGAALQLGIGAVPESIAHAISQSDVGDLRLVGMVSDPMVELADQGRISSQPQSILAVELLGTERIFSFAHENRRVEMLSSSSVHDVGWLGSHSHLVSVVSALAVDLSGQVASEQVGERLIAGIGGSVDFFEGAHLSAGGIRIVALPARTPGGGSRIQAQFPAGTPITIPRHSVDYVATEFGVAHLAGLSLDERAQALIALAAPEHRDSLQQAWSDKSKRWVTA
ncbi:MAG: acetyl-CoA hydrolase/transferase C-terminal domain-containing protein [Acidimicrobiales bacterium]